MNITEELLQKLYDRANQFSIAKYHKSIDALEINDNGNLILVHEEYSCGSYEREHTEVSIDDLSEDLDKLVEERKKKEEEERIKAEIQRKEQKRIEEERKKENRRKLYLELKQEFE
jgi:hypothetical protein